MKSIILSILILYSISLNAQKRIDKVLDAQHVSTLQIDGTNCFKIDVVASDVDQITIHSEMEGEHSEDMIVISRISRDSLFISARFQPLFKADNDKLSAHKVMSIELEIQVPKHMDLNLKSDIASVEAIGVFKTVFIELNQGQCKLKAFLGSATINTIGGAILVETNYAEVKAFSKHGVVKLQPLVSGENQLDLKSIHGDISVSKTE